MIKKILLISLFILCILLVVFILYIYNNFIFIKSSEYNRSMYSIVLYNETEEILNDITISYVHAPSDPSVDFSHISNLMNKEYRKINIPTDYQEPGSYNVNVIINTSFGEKIVSAGYFGTKTGGFTVIDIKKDNGVLVAEQLSKNERKYKKLYRRHLKNQQEISWF